MQTQKRAAMQLADNRVVLFVDLLGFALLTEHHPLELDVIKAFERPFFSGNLDVLLARENPLTRTFASFHRSLKSTIDVAQMSHPVTAITFSDAAFIATEHLFQAVRMAVDLIQALLRQRIPMRAGIAHGSFAAVRFRSDVTVDGGDHAAHFLGTAVVRSHATESCGIKGLRILLHPSAVSLLDDPFHNPASSKESRIQCVVCSTEERASNTAGVLYEVDYWRFRPTAEAEAWHALQDMWTTAPQHALKHYAATAEAINRMRIGQGEAPLTKLRRRTLPRRDPHTT